MNKAFEKNLSLPLAGEEISQHFSLAGGFARRTVKIGDFVSIQSVKADDYVGDARIAFYRATLSSRLHVDAEPSRRITYIDLFCGGGGLSLGVNEALRLIGCTPRLVLAADIDKVALELVKRHFSPLISRNQTVEKLVNFVVDHSADSADFIETPEICDLELAAYRGKIDLLVGGPPCQGHSNLNNRTRRKDPRNLLYFVMPAIATGMQIPNVIIENVTAIRSASENVVQKTTEIFKSRGYHVHEVILNAGDYGVAQTRRRHFLVASLGDMLDPSTVAATLQQPRLTFDDVTRDLPPLGYDNDLIENNGQLSAENIERIRFLQERGLFELPNEKRPDCHRESHTYPSVYGRIRADIPMQTVTTGFATPGRGRYVHPHEPRTINIREAGRVQAFPDWYWEPTRDLQFKRGDFQKIIGDAVPSRLIEPIVLALAPALWGKKRG